MYLQLPFARDCSEVSEIFFDGILSSYITAIAFSLHMENKNEEGTKREKKEGSKFVQKLGQRKKRKMIFH